MIKGNFISLKPKKVDVEVWDAVIEYWKNGLSDREAALRASANTSKQIKASDIKQWKKDNPDIAELCEMLKDDLKATAKTNVAELLDQKDDKTSRWYLEKKCPEEFSSRSAVAFEGAVIEVSLEEKQAKLDEYMESFENGE